MRLSIAIIASALAISTWGQQAQNEWIEMAARDVQRSSLTLPGSRPFHIEAEVIETTNPTSEYRARIEEYWVSPQKWYRTVESPGFSQTLVVNGDKFLEKDQGDYFPWWLNDLITATFDPLPITFTPDEVKAGKSFDPKFAYISSVCTGANTSTDQWHFCFDPRRNLLTSALSTNTGYFADFQNFEDFGKKQIPHKIVIYPESGTTIEEDITKLDELRRPNDAMFAIEESTPPPNRIARVRIGQDALLQSSITNTEIDWPPVDNRPVTGSCALYVSVDRSGIVREVRPGGCDNAGLEDALRNIVRKWHFKPIMKDGIPVQVDSRLTFAFRTRLNSTGH